MSASPMPTDDEVLGVLRRSDTGLMVTAMVADRINWRRHGAIDVETAQVLHVLKRLEQAGRVICTGRGAGGALVWTLA